MTPEIAKQRAEVVAEAKSFISTPYHHMGMVKGKNGGVDCATLLVLVYTKCGIVPPFTLAYYPKDWNLHRDAERYLSYILDRAVEMPPPEEREPLPGEVIVWKFGRTFAHGAIITDWPNVVHAYSRTNCQAENVLAAKYLCFIGENGEEHGKARPMKIYCPKAWIV